MSGPLVSVLFPVYNTAPYLAAALNSILRQDYQRIEVIAFDDGSTDGSLEILREAQRSDDRVRVVSRENRGLIATLNEGLPLAKGEFIARMDSDDISYPSRLSRQVETLLAEPDVALCSGSCDSLVGTRVWPGGVPQLFLDGDLSVLSKFFTLFVHATAMYNREVCGDDLYYDPQYVHAEDFDLFRRLAAKHPMRILNERFLAYRRHGTSVTQKHEPVMRRTHIRIVRENLEADGFELDFDALTAIGEKVTIEGVRRVAAFMLALDDQIAMRPAEARPSYEGGALNLFFFLFSLIGDEHQPELIHAYLDHSRGWGKIRRRERPGYWMAGYVPMAGTAYMAATRGIDLTFRRFHSSHIAKVVPAGWQV